MTGIPTEAYAFLGAVLVFLVLLVIFFLYLNKKFCFSECGGFPCVDDPKIKKSKSDKLGESFNAYEDADTSSDSDDEVLARYQGMQQGKRAPSPRGSVSEKVKKDDSQRDLISLTEKGGFSGGEGSADEAGSPKKVTPGTSPSASPAHDDQLPTTSATPTPTSSDPKAYSNSAYHKDVSYDSMSNMSSEKALSAYGDAASMSLVDDPEEHLYDVRDLQERELISRCGTLQVTFSYSATKGQMKVTVIQAQDIPSKDRGGANNIQVRLLLLPTKKQRHKTKIRPSTSVQFNETFLFNKLPFDDVKTMGIRFRVYGCERMRRERMIGESVLGFASLALDQETTNWLTLEPRSNLSHGDSKSDVASLSKSDSASSTQSMQHGGMPELLIGLAYNGTTGRLSVEVIKGSNFRNMAMNRAPDTYVKLTLMSPNGQEITRSKTSIRRGQPNPLFKETFMFQVALFQLPDVTLMVSVYNKRSMKRKEMIGWFSLGLNNSGEEELAHWNDMRESKGEQVCRWHVLLES